ncbi:hypothetical protein PG994_004713 [Apiospora phragmitis]|uniref:Uncharacterized protein n=1 Tax=Apiospora phragmitis TaxID=2905665 RepID=A0ABR1VRC9_9PEZI
MVPQLIQQERDRGMVEGLRNFSILCEHRPRRGIRRGPLRVLAALGKGSGKEDQEHHQIQQGHGGEALGPRQQPLRYRHDGRQAAWFFRCGFNQVHLPDVGAHITEAAEEDADLPIGPLGRFPAFHYEGLDVVKVGLIPTVPHQQTAAYLEVGLMVLERFFDPSWRRLSTAHVLLFGFKFRHCVGHDLLLCLEFLRQLCMSSAHLVGLVDELHESILQVLQPLSKTLLLALQLGFELSYEVLGAIILQRLLQLFLEGLLSVCQLLHHIARVLSAVLARLQLLFEVLFLAGKLFYCAGRVLRFALALCQLFLEILPLALQPGFECPFFAFQLGFETFFLSGELFYNMLRVFRIILELPQLLF